DLGATDFWRRVDVRDEPDRGHVLLTGSCRNAGHHITVSVDPRVLDTEIPQLPCELFEQNQLFGRAGVGLRLVVRLGVVGDISEKAARGTVRKTCRHGPEGTALQCDLPKESAACA